MANAGSKKQIQQDGEARTERTAATKVDFVPVADGFQLVPFRNEATSLKGRFAGRVAKPVSIAAMDQAIAAEAAERNTPRKR